MKLEKKIGITQTDLHATIQMSKRYSNSKAVLVLTSDVKIHNEWIKEKFYVYTSTLQDNAEKKSKENLVSEEKTMSTESDINFIKDILNNIINNLNSISNFTSIKYIDEIETDVLFKTFNKNIEIEKQNPKQKENKPNNNKFPKPRLFSELKDFEVLLNENKELRVILDEQANIIIEDEELKRKRHQARLLQRRDTLMQLDPAAELEYDESVSSEELPIQITPEMEEPEYMKNFYTKLILQSRNIYMDQHLNNPGFFSLVVFIDIYIKKKNLIANVWC